MRFRSTLLVLPLLLGSLLFSGCYQASMTTGKKASDTVVEKKWASSFIFGIVPAKIDVSEECPNGISSAKRKVSFANGLVYALTLNIYLPQTVTVTCAAGNEMANVEMPPPSEFALSEDASQQTVKRTLSEAAVEAATTRSPVKVQVATQ